MGELGGGEGGMGVMGGGGGRVRVLAEGNTLHLRQVQEEDAGTYILRWVNLHLEHSKYIEFVECKVYYRV